MPFLSCIFSSSSQTPMLLSLLVLLIRATWLNLLDSSSLPWPGLYFLPGMHFLPLDLSVDLGRSYLIVNI